jgi:predicted RNA-binding Zn-ribbon protein involved in translation (DUF1610 family)
MQVIKRYNQYRRDLSIDTKCEKCGTTETIHSAYDDRDYWTKWQPQQKCPSCGESTESLKLQAKDVHTKYPEGLQI